MAAKMCERCEKPMSFYGDETREHTVWLCWSCGKFKGISSVEDDFNDMIVYNPPLILELIEEKTLKVMDASAW